MSSLQGRKIAVCVGGGIAAYKAGDFVRELRRRGAEVRVAMTAAAESFITPLTMQSLSGHPVLTALLDPAQDEQFGHLHLARWADACAVVPATADLLARMAHGLANDAVTTSLLAFRGPVVVAPAMNTAMWEHPATVRNCSMLRATPGLEIVGPGVGPLADGDVGAGRLEELSVLAAAMERLFAPRDLHGVRVLLTAGPTREALDPVRFISNPSTGKMGLALADEAHARGANVTVVLGPVAEAPVRPYEIVPVVTAQQMLEAVLPRLNDAAVFVASAAVSDWRPAVVSNRKEKKSEGPQHVELVRTPDVLLEASKLVHAQSTRPFLVGFAAETHEVVASAKEKLARKKLDLIVANDVSGPEIGFGAEQNAVAVIDAAGKEQHVRGSKREVARRIWDIVVPLQSRR